MSCALEQQLQMQLVTQSLSTHMLTADSQSQVLFFFFICNHHTNYISDSSEICYFVREKLSHSLLYAAGTISIFSLTSDLITGIRIYGPNLFQHNKSS